jgi:formate-dependent nitrite reductase membrane component NrfD
LIVGGNASHDQLDEDRTQRGYYGVPVIHGAHWRWLIVGYFFFGGITGSAAVIGAFARVVGGPGAVHVARAATYVSFAAFVPCPLLLILDLGRPLRFLNMLRVVRPSSPMSIGSWGLAVFGVVCSLSTVLQILQDLGPRVRSSSSPRWRLAGLTLSLIGTPLGFFVAGYTGVLLAATAVPLWSKRPALLSPLFLASAMTSGAAAITAAVAISSHAESSAELGLHRFEATASLVEGVLLAAWIIALGPTARPIVTGQLGGIVRRVVIGGGIVVPLVLSAVSGWLPRRARGPATIAGALLTLTGVFALRYAVVEGGRQSADDPKATFEMTG